MLSASNPINLELKEGNHEFSESCKNTAGPGRPRKDGAPVARKRTLVTCNDCGVQVSDGIMLERHYRKNHPNKLKCHICQICSNSFFTAIELTHHYLTHWNINEVCPLSSDCLETLQFSRKAKLLRHLISDHKIDITQNIVGKENGNYKKKGKYHKCSYCSKTFDKHSQLIRHVRIHTGEKPFTCAFCGYKFNQKNSLITHVRIHTNVRPFQCPKCPMSFTQRVNMIIHMRNVHPLNPSTAKNRIKCQYCSCYFRSNFSLNFHNAKVHKTLTEDQIINNTINDVMEGLASLNSLTQPDIELFQNNLSNDQNNTDTNKTTKSNSKKRKHTTTFKIADKINIKPKIRINFHKCNVCDKSFKSESDLIKHMSIHSRRNVAEKNDTQQLMDINNILENTINPDTTISILPADKIFEENSFPDVPLLNDTNSNIFLNESQFNILVNDAFDNISNEIVYVGHDAEQSNFLLTDNSLENIEIAHPESKDVDNELNATQALDVLEEQLYFQDNFNQNTTDFGYQISVNNDDEIPTISISEENVINEDLTVTNVNDSTAQIDESQQYYIFLDQPEVEVRNDAALNINIESIQPTKIEYNGKWYKYPPLANQCDVCPASFIKPCDLVRHKKTHESKKEYSCDLCGKTFTLIYGLKSHLTTHLEHPVKKFVCKVCGKILANKRTLTIHRRIHEGVKPYPCSMCSNSFRTSGQLKVHTQTHFNGTYTRKKKIKEMLALNADERLD